MLNSKFLRNNRGFTLIEVLLSLTILGIVLTGTMSFFSQAYSYTNMNKDKTVGINVARNVLYYIEQLDYKKTNDFLEANGQITEYTNDSNITKSRMEASIDCSSPLIENKDACNSFFNATINNETFQINVTIFEHENISLREYLIPTKVNVKWGKDKTAAVEGVIKK